MSKHQLSNYSGSTETMELVEDKLTESWERRACWRQHARKVSCAHCHRRKRSGIRGCSCGEQAILLTTNHLLVLGKQDRAMSLTKQPTLRQEASSEELYQRTVKRIEKIQSHLKETPRGTRLKGKVCVITGVGSLKGIGYAFHSDSGCM